MTPPPLHAGEIGLRTADIEPFKSLTRRQRIEVLRRQRILDRVAELKAGGLSEIKAAKVVRVSPSTLWLWRRRIIPQYNKITGRKPVFDAFKIGAGLISKVQKLRIEGCSNEKAWRALANDPDCPKDLSEFLQNSPSIPPSFLLASRLAKLKATVICGIGFTHISQLRGTK